MSLGGRVLTVEQLQAGRECCAAIHQPTPATVSVDEVQVLLDEATPWVLINRPVDDLRQEPSLTSMRVSQALLGESARLIEGRDCWSYIRLERDGYLGWIHTAALHRCPTAEVAAYQAASQARVIAELLPAWLEKPSPRGENIVVGRLPFGVCLLVEKWESGLAWVRLPDGRSWWAPSDGLLPHDQRPEPDTTGIDFTLKLIPSPA